MGKWFGLKPSVVIERGSDMSDWGDTVTYSMYHQDAKGKLYPLFICNKTHRFEVLEALNIATSEVNVHSGHSDVYGCWVTSLRFNVGTSFFHFNVHKDLRLDCMTVRESEEKFFDERMQLLERD
jgi:hypothetical protein